MPDPKRSPSSAAKTLFQTAAEMFGGGPLGGDDRSFADVVLERLAAKRSAAEAVKVEPAKPIPIDVKVVVADNDPAQLERFAARAEPGAGDTLGPAGPGQWLVEGPGYGLPSPGLGDAFKRPPLLGDRVYFTPPPNPDALRAEKRLDAFYPVRPYPAPVVLAADVIRVDAEGTVSLFVKCPVEGPYAVHRVEQAPDGVEPGTAEAACLWSWPPARLT
jgi:hypothetical protein